MTSRRDRLALGILLLAYTAGLTGCGQRSPDVAPLERAKGELASGHAAGAKFILVELLSEGAPSPALAAYFGEAALARGDLEEAARWLDPGNFSEDTRAHGLRMQGRLAMARGNLPAAGQAFDRSLSLDPGSAALWVDIGRLRYRGGEQLQALEAADRAVALGPQQAVALQFRGQLSRDSQGVVPSIRWFERALAAQPGNLDIRIDLAATLGDAGRAKAALGVLRGEGGQAVGHPRGEFIQGVIAARGGKFSLARDFLERSGLGKEGVASALLLSAIIDIHEGNFDSAAQTLDRLYGRQPDNGRVVDLLALALSRGGSEAELVHRFEKRAAGPAGSNYLRTLVGRAYEAMDDRVSASRFLDLAAQGSRGLSALPISGGLPEERDRIRSAIARGQSVDALRQARAFARQFPGSCDALALLGDALLVSGNREEAAQAYSKSAKVRKPWPLVPRMASSVNGKAAARYMLEDFVVANPLNGEAAAMLSDAYALEGQWTRAAALLDHAMSLGHGRVPWVLSARSIAAAHLGESEEALQYAIAANSLQPMNQSAVRALLGSLPREQVEARAELSTKLRSLGRR